MARARHDPRVWLEEFAALRVHMAAHYANLDWMAAHRGVDLPRLRRETEERLGRSLVGWQARWALQRFVSAFDDPHLRLVAYEPPAPPEPPSARDEPAAGAAAARRCADRGFVTRDRAFLFPFSSAPGWLPAGGAWFPSGSFGDIGVIRVAHFGEDGYLEACEEAGPDQVRERLLQDLRATIRELRGRGVRAMVLDITGNGGGTEWVGSVTRLFTSKRLRRPGALMMEPDCDRTPVWDGRKVCAGLTGGGESTMQGEGDWDGPLALLVDGRTASASEDLVVWMRESGAAIVLGERTYGAGCGYARGGAPARMPRIGLTVLMPNCARFTSDGVNEVEGIAPDIPVPVHEGAAAARVARLTEALSRIAR